MTQSRHGLVHCTCLLLTQSGHAACKYPCDCLIKLAFGPTRSMRARARYFVRDESLPRLQSREGPMDGQRYRCKAESFNHRRNLVATFVTAAALWSAATLQMAQAQQQPAPAAGQKPNILIIFGDDIGVPQISAYTMGMMGYKTPNIDRIAREGAIFTDSYGQQSCTAGRASFILGQEPFRTGLLTIGMPGDPHGIQEWMPTIADVLKTQGYATGQLGTNHLGDRDEHLPTKHGFDEFFGNLYHLNAEEEPEGYFYPRDPEFKKKYGPRGVI